MYANFFNFVLSIQYQQNTKCTLFNTYRFTTWTIMQNIVYKDITIDTEIIITIATMIS